MRERWTEDLVCPNCQKTGRAELSQTDDQSGDIEAELVPAGFKVIQLEHGPALTPPMQASSRSL